MGYKQEHYNEVLSAVQKYFGIQNADMPGYMWIAWRVSIKKLFDEDVSIREIISAIPEAAEKQRWPFRTSFWRRVHDVVLKNRQEEKRTSVRTDLGAENIGDILKRRYPQPPS